MYKKKSSSEIISEILKLKFNKIIIIGHSLGGYLCQAMAYDLLINYNIKSNIFIYAFRIDNIKKKFRNYFGRII